MMAEDALAARPQAMAPAKTTHVVLVHPEIHWNTGNAGRSCLAAGATYFEAAHLANYAGGIVVMKRRTATVTRAELESILRREATAQH